MSVTIKDIARAAGVSVGAVSQVLGDYPSARIATDTRQRILSVARQLGYRRNLHARALSTGKSMLIGLLTDNLNMEVCLAKTLAISRIIMGRGYRDLLRNTGSNLEMELQFIDEYVSSKVQGVILAQSISLRAQEAIGFLTDSGIPVISLEPMPRLPIDCITIDRKHGGYIATKHLLELGHRRIGVIHADPGMHAISERLQGYAEALSEYDIPLDDSLMSRMDEGSLCASGYQATRILLERNKDITAIFCHNDSAAIGAMRAVREAGLSIPDDMAIVGFDDIEAAAFGPIPLTTVAQPVEELARVATDLLFERMVNRIDGKTQMIRLEPRLIVRNSTAATPAANQECSGVRKPVTSSRRAKS